jgi:hypothetical protein
MDVEELLERLKNHQRDIEERFWQSREELENILGAIQVITGWTAHSSILGEERAREASTIFLAQNTIPINLRTPGAGKEELIKEIKDCLRKERQEIAGRDETVADLEQYPKPMLSSSVRAALEGHIQDRDLLTIKREFYNDLLQVLINIQSWKGKKVIGTPFFSIKKSNKRYLLWKHCSYYRCIFHHLESQLCQNCC